MAAESASALREFLCDIKCYDLVPISSKVLVFDVDISIQLAFYAFVEHGGCATGVSLQAGSAQSCPPFPQACLLPHCGTAEKAALVAC